MTAPAYERIIDRLHDLDLRPRTSYGSTTARCPSHDDRSPSLAVYDKEGKAKVHCFAGCDDELDILPALGLKVADVYDEKRPGKNIERTQYFPDPEALARHEARRTMAPSQKALDDLTHRPDFAERLCKTIGRFRPELYVWDKHDLADEVDAEPHPHYEAVIDQLASRASLASHASDQYRGVVK